jgi:hypothetical protein
MSFYCHESQGGPRQRTSDPCSAAEDGVKPQTVEALNHAKASGVPIVVSVN